MLRAQAKTRPPIRLQGVKCGHLTVAVEREYRFIEHTSSTAVHLNDPGFSRNLKTLVTRINLLYVL